MGVIEKLWIKLTCNGCGATETSSALDKGSGWSGSQWGSLGSFTLFDVICEGGGKNEPNIVSAKCKACSSDASVKTAYGFGRPSDF
jgi:hypothetical protein